MAADEERLRRWRLILGGETADGICCGLGRVDEAIDGALAALYDAGGEGGQGGQQRTTERRGNLGSSAPNVARWLGDIRTYFPSSVVRVMQQDALERLNLRQMLLDWSRSCWRRSSRTCTSSPRCSRCRA
jgi:hypothetical protein